MIYELKLINKLIKREYPWVDVIVEPDRNPYDIIVPLTIYVNIDQMEGEDVHPYFKKPNAKKEINHEWDGISIKTLIRDNERSREIMGHMNDIMDFIHKDADLPEEYMLNKLPIVGVVKVS